MKLSFQPERIHPYFFPQYRHPIQINYGDCFRWAYLASKLFKGVELWSYYLHAFISYDGKFYDSECLFGTKKWQKLRTIKENRGLFPKACRMSEKEFTDYWSRFNCCDWNELDIYAAQYLKSRLCSCSLDISRERSIM